MDDVMGEIENKQAQHDLGVTAFRIYRGARKEGASRFEAYTIVWAWFGAMFETSKEEEDQDDA